MSDTTDDLDFYGPEEMYDSETSLAEWEDKDNNIVLIQDLANNHLQNIIVGLAMGKDYYGQGHKLSTLQNERNRRQEAGKWVN